VSIFQGKVLREEPVLISGLVQTVLALLLAFGGGTFLYLGYHAVHAEWKRRTAGHKHARVSLH